MLAAGCLVGLLAFILIGIGVSADLDTEFVGGVAGALLIAGLLTAMAPWNARRYEESVADLAAAATRPPQSSGSGAALAADVIGTLRHERMAFVRLLGPWLAIYGLAPLSLPLVMDDDLSRLDALWVLVGAIVWLLILPLAGVIWSRFLLKDLALGAVPNAARALWSWVWRIGLTLSIVSHIEKAEPYLARLLSVLGEAASPTAKVLLEIVGGLMLLVWLTFALVLPARAIGDREMTMSKSIVEITSFRFRFMGGALLLALPSALMGLAYGLAETPGMTTFAGAGSMSAFSILQFLTFIAVATLLAETYRKILVARP